MANFTAKQQAFIDHYLICLNGTEAARRAMYAGDDNTLAVIAYENLRKPKIKEEIEEKLAYYTASSEAILVRLSEQAMGGHGDYVTPDGDVDIAKLVEDGRGHLVKSVKQTRYGKSFEFYDSQAAIDKLMRYYGLYKDKMDITSGGEKLSITLEWGDNAEPDS